MDLFSGSSVAIVTPFNSDLSVDYNTYKQLIEFQINNGSKAIICLGTTGEATTLRMEEYKAVVKRCIEIVDKRVPVIVGTGSNSTTKAKEFQAIAEQLGADGLLIVTPYYNKGSERGIYEHYKFLAENTKLPIILYNVPSRTNVNLSIENIKKLSQFDNIIGIKEASGNSEYLKEILPLLNANFSLYSGNDNKAVEIIKSGGSGLISVIANIIPQEISDICDLALKKEYQKAEQLFAKISKLEKLMYCEVNPIPVKKSLNLIGYDSMNLRLPLFELDEKLIDPIKEELNKLKLI